jgi:hypothetical protein
MSKEYVFVGVVFLVWLACVFGLTYMVIKL